MQGVAVVSICPVFSQLYRKFQRAIGFARCVSRHHSNLTLNDDGSVSLSDNYSKFGTLLLMRKPYPISIKSKETTYV